MPSRQRKINSASLEAPPPVIDAAAQPVEWAKIEDAYGCVIPARARVQMVEVANKYLEFSAFALAARPLSESIDRAQAIKKSAAALLGHLAEQTANDLVADGSIERNLAGLSFPPNRYNLTSAADLLSCLIAACSKAINDLDSGASSGLCKDEHWRLWVRRMTEISEQHSLPTRVRKDRDGNIAWSPSPFVFLICAIQDQFPSEHCRVGRREPASEALSQAIVAARREVRGP